MGWLYNHFISESPNSNNGFIECYRINNSPKLILFRSKWAFVGHFFEELQTCFQLALSLTRSLTILGTAGMNLACVRRALEFFH